MSKRFSIFLIIACVLFAATLCHAAEEYEFLRKWTPDTNPRSLAVDSDGYIYAAGDQKVIKYSSSGSVLLTIQNITGSDNKAK